MLNPYFLIPLSLTILAGGWLLAKHEPDVVRIILRFALAAIALTFGVLVLTGIQHATLGEVHRYAGHGLTIVVWLWGMFALGAVWRRDWPRWGVIVGRTLLLILSVGVTLLASISGYLGPTHAAGAGEETYNRFVMQHYFVFPLLLCLSVGLFSRREWRRGKN